MTTTGVLRRRVKITRHHLPSPRTMRACRLSSTRRHPQCGHRASAACIRHRLRSDEPVTDYVRMTGQRYLGSGKGAQSRAAWPDEMFNEEIYQTEWGRGAMHIQ